MKSNEILQKDVQDALIWEPLLHAAEIGVIVEDGIVTLTGTVDSYLKKKEAETAAKKVAGVKAIVENIEVRYQHDGKTDNELALEVINALKRNSSVPENQIMVTVEDGGVTLEGSVKWNYQREASRNAIISLSGIKGITNNIKIEDEIPYKIGEEAIKKALQRNWAIAYDAIDVVVSGNNVTLLGVVDSYYEKEEAERIVWNAPGVCSVNNELEVADIG